MSLPLSPSKPRFSEKFNKIFAEGFQILRREYPQIDWSLRQRPMIFILGYVGDELAVSIREALGGSHFRARITPVKKIERLSEDVKFCLWQGPVKASPLEAMEGLLQQLDSNREKLRRIEATGVLLQKPPQDRKFSNSSAAASTCSVEQENAKRT